MSFIMLVPFLGLLVIIVIWDKLESIPSVRKGKHSLWFPPPTPGSQFPVSTTAKEISNHSSPPEPLFSVSDKQPLIRIHSVPPSHRYHGHVGCDTDDENEHNTTQDYEYDDYDDYDSYDGYSYIWGYDNGFADGTESAERDIEEARHSGYGQGFEDGNASAYDDDDYDDYNNDYDDYDDYDDE